MQIPSELLKCVAFMARSEKTDYKFCGTVFFVGYPLPGVPDRMMWYGVTARHVIDDIRKLGVDGQCYFRANTKDGRAVFVKIVPDAWAFHADDRVDVAVIPLTIDPSGFDHLTWMVSDFVTNETIAKEGIGPGDDLFFPGLFTRHFGEASNIPIIRMGNIAAMPGERIKLDWGNVRGYLVEARSIGGLSGSPVFVHTGGLRERNGKLQVGPSRFGLLGLVHGHFGLRDALDSDADAFSLASSKSVNMGIAVVIPADDILATLDQPQFAKARADAAAVRLEERTGNQSG